MMATMQYNVKILVSGELVTVMTKDVKKFMREVDTITVKGSAKPIKLFTVDVQTEDFAEVTDRVRKLQLKDKKRFVDRERFVLWEGLKRRAMTTINVFRNDSDFSALRKNVDRGF